MRVRVLVYNVRGFRAKPRTVARAVRELEPDVVLLQECGSGRRLRKFANTLGMRNVAGRLWPFLRTVRSAVLVRPPWRVVSSRLHRFARSRRFYPRGALIANVGREGFRLWALSVHLGLVPEERRRHAEELTDLVASLSGPVVVGGDLNEGPGGGAASWIAARLWDAWAAGEGEGATFPSADPTARIDYLFASEHLRIDNATVVTKEETRGASDHLPLLIDLTLRQ